MQFSLPTFLPVSPEAALPGAAVAPGEAAATPTGGEPTAVSFEELLPGYVIPPARSGPDEAGPDVEKTASILAASFWMPLVTLPAEAQVEPATAEAAGTEGPIAQPAAGRRDFTCDCCSGARGSRGDGASGCSAGAGFDGRAGARSDHRIIFRQPNHWVRRRRAGRRGRIASRDLRRGERKSGRARFNGSAASG